MAVKEDADSGSLSSLAKTAADSGYFRLVAQAAMTLAAPTLIWTASALWDISKQQSALTGRIDGLQIRIEAQMDNRYRATDAERDFRLRDQLIGFLKDQTILLEKRVERVEQSAGIKKSTRP